MKTLLKVTLLLFATLTAALADTPDTPMVVKLTAPAVIASGQPIPFTARAIVNYGPRPNHVAGADTIDVFSFYIAGPGYPSWTYIGGTLAGFTADAQQTWTWTPSSPLADGDYIVTVQAWDSEGLCNSDALAYFHIGGGAPQTRFVRVPNVVSGSDVTFYGGAIGPDGLNALSFYIAGPSYPGWTYVAGVGVSGTSDSASVGWTPPSALSPGRYIVAMQVWDVNSAYDTIYSSFTVAPSGRTHNFQILVDTNQLTESEADDINNNTITFSTDGVFSFARADMPNYKMDAVLDKLNQIEHTVTEDDPVDTPGSYTVSYNTTSSLIGRPPEAAMIYWESNENFNETTYTPAQLAYRHWLGTYGPRFLPHARRYSAWVDEALTSPYVDGMVFEFQAYADYASVADVKACADATLAAGRRVYLLIPPCSDTGRPWHGNYVNGVKDLVDNYLLPYSLLSNPNVYLIPAAYLRPVSNVDFADLADATNALATYRQTGSW